MSDRASAFVDEWIRENIHAQAYLAEDEKDTRPAEYARQCLAAAEEEGITPEEISSAVGNLEEVMANAITSAADEEVDRLVEKDPF